MSTTSEMEMQVAIACTNGFGSSDMPVFKVMVSEEEYENGVHYEKARRLAGENGYQGPFVCFDIEEYSEILSAVRELGLT